MQVKPETVHHQLDVSCHQTDAPNHQTDDSYHSHFKENQDMVIDLSRSRSAIKQLGERFAVSDSGALDLSAPKYKHIQENTFSNFPRKSRNSLGQPLEDDSDGEEGRLVIDDAKESQNTDIISKVTSGTRNMEATNLSDQVESKESQNTKIETKMDSAGHNMEIANQNGHTEYGIPQSLGILNGNSFANGEMGRKMYQHLLINKENGAGNYLKSQDGGSISYDARSIPTDPVLPVFSNMNANNAMQLNIAQTLMFMNMNSRTGNGMMPFLNPVTSSEQSASTTHGNLKGKISDKINTDIRREKFGAVKHVTSGRKARLATGNQTSDKSVVEIYECKICNRKFSQVGNFHNHMKTHNNQAERVCVCGICKMEFRDSYELQRHMRTTHTGDMPYKCEQCDREFSQYNNLRRHLRVHSGNMYKCQICGRTFNESFYLEMHLSSHTGERTYKCGICSFTCKDNTELQMHVKSHRADELHTCDVCNKSFSKACVLRQHKKMHTGIRPFKCDVCGKAFIHRHHLTIHSRMHSTNRPYTCKICGKEFAQTSHLYKHIRQHNEENISGIEVKKLLEELRKSDSNMENKMSRMSPTSSDGNMENKMTYISPPLSDGNMENKTLCVSPPSSDEDKGGIKSGMTNGHTVNNDVKHTMATQSKEPEVAGDGTFTKSAELAEREENIIEKIDRSSLQRNFEQSMKEIPKLSPGQRLSDESGKINEEISEKMEDSLIKSDLNQNSSSNFTHFGENGFHHEQKMNLELLSNTVSSVAPDSAKLFPLDKFEDVHNSDDSKKSHCDSEKQDIPENREHRTNNQVLVDKIINHTQGDPCEAETTKEHEIVLSYPHKQTKENADIVGGLVARLLQETNNTPQQKSAEKKRRTPGKRKPKNNNLTNGENLFRPIIPPTISPEEHQIYLMQLQQMQAVQMAMINSVGSKDPLRYHGNEMGYPVSPNMHSVNNRFDFEKFHDPRSLPAHLEEIKNSFEYARKVYASFNAGQGHLPFVSPNGVLDMTRVKIPERDNGKFWNKNSVHQKTVRNSPGRFSSPSLSDEFSDEAIDMSSKRSHTGSVSSQLSEDTVESE